jgi:anti-anti-sigma factor
VSALFYEFSFSMNPNVSVMTLTGVFDGTQTVRFRESVGQLFENGADIILLDCQDLGFIDSSGLGALISGLKMARAADKKLYLCSVNKQVGMLLDLTDTRRVFEIFADQTEFNRMVLKHAAA